MRFFRGNTGFVFHIVFHEKLFFSVVSNAENQKPETKLKVPWKNYVKYDAAVIFEDKSDFPEKNKFNGWAGVVLSYRFVLTAYENIYR